MVITDVNQVVYQGNGSNTAFPFTFRIIDATDIKLMLVDTDNTETPITSDFWVDTANNTVYYPGYAPGSEPPLADRPPVLDIGQKLIVYRALPVTQEKDLGDAWPFYVIELALDKLTMLIQGYKDSIGRCLKVRISDTEFNTEFTPVAGKAIEVNETGDGFHCVDSPTTVLIQCEAVLAETQQYADSAENSANNAADSATSAANDADDAADSAAAAIQANNSAQGALIDADALLNATKGYISAATVNGFWDDETEYEAGDVVMTTDGSVFRCIQDNTNKPPVTSPNYWAQVTTTELLTFEIDHNGDLMPLINPSASQNWDIDENDDIMPASLSSLSTVDNQEF